MDISIADKILDKVAADMRSASALIDRLQKLGYKENFILIGNKLMCLRTHDYYFPNDFQVDEIYCIDEEVIGLKEYYVYVLRQLSNDLKGIFVLECWGK
jgi:hypothetical protein